MRTALTPDFYQLFAVLLVVAVAVLFIVAAVAESLYERLLSQWSPHRAPSVGTVPNVPDKGRTASPVRRTPVPR